MLLAVAQVERLRQVPDYLDPLFVAIDKSTADPVRHHTRGACLQTKCQLITSPSFGPTVTVFDKLRQNAFTVRLTSRICS